jgi:hypothetical protein
LEKVNHQSENGNNRLYKLMEHKYKEKLEEEREKYQEALNKIKQNHQPFDKD